MGWDEAMDRIASAISTTGARWGKQAVGVFGGGSLTNEKAYLLGKFARVALGTPNIDYNGRFCMSSAAAAMLRAFGIDRGLPFPLEDIPKAKVVLLAGANVAETMPPAMYYFDAQRVAGGELIVVDPRRTETVRSGSLHLRLKPGTDSTLASGILHVLVWDGFIDESYIASRTEGFAASRGAVAAFWPERVERITGVPEADIVRAARMLGEARSAMILTARGVEQHSHGVDNVLSYINIALSLGLPGKQFSGFGSITGQGNGQGGREHGQKADQLPGYRKIDDPAARRHMAQVWGLSEQEIPGPGMPAYELLSTLGREGGVRCLLVFGSNVVVSAPDANVVAESIKRLDFLAVSDFFLSETAQMADVVLPSAQWAEEEGTVTNLEGRVIRRRRVFPPPEGVRTDVEAICDLAARLGRGGMFNYSGPRDVFEELRRASKGGIADYSGISYERIEKETGVFWPCPAEDHPGTPRLFTERFPTPSGRAVFHAARHHVPAEETDAEFPLILTTGRLKAHYQSGTQTRRVGRLAVMAPGPLAEMHPSTAARLGLASGDSVILTSRRGRMTATVKATHGIRQDTVFVPFHWGGDQSVNRLTNPALDPVSRMPEFKACAVRLEPAGKE